MVRKSLEQHRYVQVMRFVDLKEHNYILANAAVKFGDFHALMQALQGVASSDPDAYLTIFLKDAKALELEPQAEWLAQAGQFLIWQLLFLVSGA